MNQDIRPSRRFYRSRDDRMIAGVAGGLAKYFDLDPVLVRLGVLLLGLSTGVGILAYFILAIVVPQEPLDDQPSVTMPSSAPARADDGLTETVDLRP